ncbi:MAG: alpha/beta fold hydrolase [Steroidobacteraceae bacterium]
MTAQLPALCVDRRGAASPAAALPIVMLHGWGMNLRAFDALRADLPERETWAIDLPGHGRSPWWPAAAAFEVQRAAVLAMLPPRCVLVGWSFGGKLALSIAAEHPARVAALVLISATPRHMQSDDWPQGMKPDAMRAFRRALAQDWQKTLDDFIWLQLRGSRNAEQSRAAIAAALAAQGAPEPAALASGLELLGSVDLRGSVPHVTQPTLVIVGASDRVTPPAAAQWLVQQLPRASLVEVPRAGHAPLVSHHLEVAAALRDFLAGVPADAP